MYGQIDQGRDQAGSHPLYRLGRGLAEIEMTLHPFWIGKIRDGEAPYEFCDECWCSYGRSPRGQWFHMTQHDRGADEREKALVLQFLDEGSWVSSTYPNGCHQPVFTITRLF